MLYLIGYPESESNWTGTFMRSVRHELQRHMIEFTELPPYDWSGPTAPLKRYLRINSKDEDVWLVGWAHSPVIEYLKHKKGRKFGLVVGVMAGHFDPLKFSPSAKSLWEGERLSSYDGLFAISHWCQDCLLRAYPHLRGKISVTGFPLDFSAYESYLGLEKEKGLVAFNQRFSLERLPILELELAGLLVRRGHRVVHLSGVSVEQISGRDPTLADLLQSANHYGLEFVHNITKVEYNTYLAKAEIVITTSIADTLSVAMVEAIFLGAIPAAPRAFCFPEYIHPDNLYSPYTFYEILAIAEEKPRRPHRIEQYDKEHVVRRILAAMELI